ncbi:hypothetical protein ACVPOR_06030 [Staphylococcus aureus]
MHKNPSDKSTFITGIFMFWAFEWRKIT